MDHAVGIENIQELRRQEGIEDVELWDEIHGLEVGDFVNLTLLASANAVAGETLLVRITSIRGSGFRGKLAARPASAGLARLPVGFPIVFAADHIHSVQKRRPTRGH